MGSKQKITVEMWEEALEGFLLNIFFNELLINPKEHKVVVLEELTMSIPFKEALTRMLLKRFGAPAVLFFSSPIASLLPIDTRTALIVDIGYSGISIVPIYEGKILSHASVVSNLGVKKVEDRLSELILQHAKILDTSAQSKRPVERGDLCEVGDMVRGCCVLPFESSPNSTKKDPSYEFLANKRDMIFSVSSTKKFLVPADVRTHAAEILFEGDEENETIATQILSCLQRCAVDVRYELARNVLLKGGGVMFGIKRRILGEISSLTSTHEQFKGLSNLSPHFAFLTNPSLSLSYVGASMLGSVINSLTKKEGVLTAADYDLVECAYDWTHLATPSRAQMHSFKNAKINFEFEFSPLTPYKTPKKSR